MDNWMSLCLSTSFGKLLSVSVNEEGFGKKNIEILVTVAVLQIALLVLHCSLQST